MVGNIRFDVLHTPGHTPEHLAFVVTDTAGATAPMGVVTGDFVFVGDVGRPDLLEKAARVAGSADGAARALWKSLEKFRALPDHLQVWPGHGAGSACGKGMSAVPQSTVGYEKLFNWAFGAASEQEFVGQVLADQPEPPKYFAEMKRLNRDGPAILDGFRRPPKLDAAKLPELIASGALVVDARPSDAFAARHVPGTIHIPLGRSFTTWAGWLLPYDRPFYLLVSGDSPARLDEALRDLALIGLDGAAGWFGADAIAAWGGAGRVYGSTAIMTPDELAERRDRGEVAVLDVRGQSEWKAGHLPGVTQHPARLPARSARRGARGPSAGAALPGRGAVPHRGEPARGPRHHGRDQPDRRLRRVGEGGTTSRTLGSRPSQLSPLREGRGASPAARLHATTYASIAKYSASPSRSSIVRRVLVARLDPLPELALVVRAGEGRRVLLALVLEDRLDLEPQLLLATAAPARWPRSPATPARRRDRARPPGGVPGISRERPVDRLLAHAVGAVRIGEVAGDEDQVGADLLEQRAHDGHVGGADRVLPHLAGLVERQVEEARVRRAAGRASRCR